MTTTQNPSKLSAYLGVGVKIILPVFLARLLMDTSTRILYPFIPQISAGLGLTVLGYSWLMFIRAIVNISSPVFGVLSDRRGRRILMAGALLLQATGTGGLIIFKQWWAVLPIIISGIGIAAFYPSQQAYISEQAHPARRGRALAVIESSWSLVGIFILPIVGWLIDDFSWRIPFLALSLLSLIGIAVLWFQLPPVPARQTSTRLSLAEIRAVFLKSNVLASVGVVLLIYIPVAELVTIWGIWLSQNFGFSAVSIGWVATGIGLAELAGVLTSGLIIDRVGKKRSGLIGALVLALGFALLPLTQATLWPAMILLVLVSAFYEFLLVSMVPVYAEQEPVAQGTILSLVVVGSGIGSGLGSPVATSLWNLTGDLRGISAVAVICLLLAFTLIKKFLRG